MKKSDKITAMETVNIETTSSISPATPQTDPLKKLQAEIKKRLPKCKDSAQIAIEKTQGAVCNAIRIGWLVRDVMAHLKHEATITFESWIDANFQKEWSVAGAKRIAKISKDFQIDLEYNAMRDRFGLDPLLVESVSEDSLEKQLSNESRKSSYTTVLRCVGLLPGKAESKPKTKAEKSAEQKVIDSLSRAIDKYFKLKSTSNPTEWDGHFVDSVLEKLLIFKNEYEALSVLHPDAVHVELELVKDEEVA